MISLTDVEETMSFIVVFRIIDWWLTVSLKAEAPAAFPAASLTASNQKIYPGWEQLIVKVID